MSNNRYEFETNQMTRINAKLLYVSASKYGGDWTSVKHSHNFTELFYVISGKGRFELERESLPLVADDLIIVNPNVDHTEIGSSQDPLEYIVLGIEGFEFLFKDNSQEKENLYTKYNNQAHRDETLFYFQALLHELEHKKNNFAAVCQSFLDVLIVKIMRQGDLSVTVTDNKKSSKECAIIKRYIDNHYSETITLDMLAALTHMNKYYLVHAFKRENGSSPINYLIHRRITESKNLLTSTNYSLSHIAHALGFSSQSYFSQSFRRFEDMSPNEYRRQHSK